MGDIHSILFVCTGNSCRSVMAEGLMRKRLYELGKDNIEAASAGVMAIKGLPPTQETIKVMKEADVDVSEFKTKLVTDDMIKKADLVLTMEPAQKDVVVKKVPQAASKTFLLKEYKNPSKILPKGFSIHDPIGKPVEDYKVCRDEIKAEIERIAELV
jgi:protein-tyrosine-phosphatase